jgi:hypothetical protein
LVVVNVAISSHPDLYCTQAVKVSKHLEKPSRIARWHTQGPDGPVCRRRGRDLGRIHAVDDPIGAMMKMPTNTAFYDDGLARLAVASLGGWTIASMAMAAPGLPLVYP